MARFLARCSLSACLAIAAAEIDSTALIQQMTHSSEELRPEEIDNTKPDELWICSSKDLAQHEKDLKEFEKKKVEEEERILQQQRDEFSKTMTEYRTRMQRITEPLTGALWEGLYMTANATSPVAKDLVKFVMQSIAKPDHKYTSSYSKLNISASIETLGDNMAELEEPGKDLVAQAVAGFDERLDEAAKPYPKLVPMLANSSNLPHTAEGFGHFLEYKVLPVFLVEAFPPLGKWVPILANIPKNQSKIGDYIKDNLVPAKCQPGQMMADMALTFGSIGEKIEAFVKHCTEAVFPRGSTMFAAKAKAPKRRCSTCQEQYSNMVYSLSTSETCMSHCMGTVPACVIGGGLTNGCLGAMSPCLRCLKNRLAQYDSCLGTKENKETVEKLSALFDSVTSGTVEQAGVDKFLDKFSTAFVKGTFVDPDFVKTFLATSNETSTANASTSANASDKVNATAKAKAKKAWPFR